VHLARDLEPPQDEPVGIEEPAEVAVGENAGVCRISQVLDAILREGLERVGRGDLVDDQKPAAGPRHPRHLREGELGCTGCSARYAITRGIPRLLPPAISVEAHETAERFGYEWTRFAEIRPEYEDQMLGWIAPIGRDDFAGRRVLDAGCGKGRHLRLAAAFGAKEVIGVDLGPAVDVAAQHTADLENVHVIQGDLTHPPLRDETMDLIYSIGVLHHIPVPEAGFRFVPVHVSAAQARFSVATLRQDADLAPGFGIATYPQARTAGRHAHPAPARAPRALSRESLTTETRSARLSPNEGGER